MSCLNNKIIHTLINYPTSSMLMIGSSMSLSYASQQPIGLVASCKDHPSNCNHNDNKISHEGGKFSQEQIFLSVHREKKLSHFDLKSWITGGIIIRPGKVSNWRIFESIWLSMLSQFDSQFWVNLTHNVESIWLTMLSQFDSQRWVNLTLIVEPIWLSLLSQFDSHC